MKRPKREGGSRLLLLGAIASLGAAVLAPSCSSGLEGLDAKGTTGRVYERSTNTRIMFDPLVKLTSPITDVDVTGGVIPTVVTSGAGERPVAFVAFVTAANSHDADGAGTPLDPNADVDTNGVSDVFIAAVDATQIDERAFEFAIAGTMRHDRCRTCHQMNVPQTATPAPTPFLNSEHFPKGGGQPPLNELDDETCKGCHFEDWLAPGPTFDLRNRTTEDLFLRALVPPQGLDIHFRTDSRVLWALGVGENPFGLAADNDHDGVVEPEDFDGVRRHAPGGIDAFIRHLDGLIETEDPVSGIPKFSSAPDAVQSIVCASRADPLVGNAPANGAARAPSIVYVANPGYVAGVSDPTAVPAGFVHCAFESDATNMIGGGGNVFTDIFRCTIGVFQTPEGKIDLRYDTSAQVHVSDVSPATGVPDDEGNGDATMPDIGGDGSRIAFVSTASKMVAGFGGFCRPEVYLWDESMGVSLVSHDMVAFATPGDAGATNPRISSDGEAVSFESDATNLVANDTNGARDVFYAVMPGLTVVRASVDENGNEFAGHSSSGSIYHDPVGGGVKVAFACQDNALPTIDSLTCPDETVTLTAFQDTWVSSTATASNFGTDTSLFAGRTGTSGGNAIRRSLVQFDLSSIPAGSTINSVSLHMNVTQQPGGTDCPSPVDNPVNVHRKTAFWADTTATWTNASGSFDGVVSATRTLVNGSLGDLEWIGAQLTQDVQDWIDGTEANFGWILVGSSTSCTVRKMASEDAGTGFPYLEIDYTPPSMRVEQRLGPPGEQHVFLRDEVAATTIRLNQIVGPSAPGEAELRTPAAATDPVISPYGNAVLFVSHETATPALAHNLDFVRPFDENRKKDVVLVDLQQFDAQGYVLPYTLSVTPDGAFGNDDSGSPIFAGFDPPTDLFPLGLATFGTRATNLGNSDPGDANEDGIIDVDNHMLMFLSEGASVVADFRPEPAVQGQNRGVVFDNRASGKPTTFLWDFGDGGTSTQKRPTHVYTTPGKYDVTLTVSGPLGNDSQVRKDVVEVLDAVMATFTTTKDFSESVDQDPAINVAFGTSVTGAINDTDATSRLLFSMDSSGTTNMPTDFTWTLTKVMPAGAARIVSRDANPTDVAVDEVGTYELRLDADGPGGVGTVMQQIQVFEAVDAVIGSVQTPSTIVGSPIIGDAPFNVDFLDLSTGDFATSFGTSWNFGDGSSAIGGAPFDVSHSFNPGTWEVALTIGGAAGDSSKVTRYVVSRTAVTSLFGLTPAGGPEQLLKAEAIDTGSGVVVDFANYSERMSGGGLTFLWNFGLSAVTGQETLAAPSVSYALTDPIVTDPNQAFTFSISLNAKEDDGVANNTNFGSLKLYPQPSVVSIFDTGSFAATPTRPPHTVGFSASVAGAHASTNPTFRWLHGTPGITSPLVTVATGTTPDFEFSTDPAPVFEFDSPGEYNVWLEISTDGPYGTRQSVLSDPHTITVDSTKFTDWYTTYIGAGSGAKCINCHSGAFPAGGGLDWAINAGEDESDVRARIVQVPSTACNPAFFRVDPGNADASVVYNVLLNPSGPLCGINMRVNLAGDESDKDDAVANLRSWINGGALDD